MSILLLGANGQVGAHIARLADCTALDRHRCDFTTLTDETMERLIETHTPTHIINAAGFTAVDAAEKQTELARLVNAKAPADIARIAAKYNIPFLHFSTDYVFDGKTGAPYREEARAHPLNQYGSSKLQGERAVLEAGGMVFRLQWIYDKRGGNFYLTMRKLLSERPTLSIVADQLGAPSYAGHVAEAVLKGRDLAPGLYHLAAGGYTSWHGFACAIAAATDSDCAIAPITSAEYPTPAARPKDTRLDCTKLAELGITLPHWREGLKEVLA